jgi:uncharacterized OB-fold protein
MSDEYADVPTKGRLRPAISRDTAFFWEGAAQRRLLIQRCAECGALRHPPAPSCSQCHSFEWDTVEAGGRGFLYSFTVQYHPPPAGWTIPPIVGVIELVEGIRLISNVVGVRFEDLRVGEELEVFFLDQEEGWTVPQFRRPATAVQMS